MSAFGSLPDNVIIMNKWIPQIRVLSKAAVHITHGGFTSVRESIETEVPMIVIPFDADQPGNAARIVYHNLGVRVLPNELVGAKLVELTRQVYTSPSFKENVRNMKIAFDRQRSKQSAADIVESLLREKS
jgi:MGT family glycosyltransferase